MATEIEKLLAELRKRRAKLLENTDYDEAQAIRAAVDYIEDRSQQDADAEERDEAMKPVRDIVDALRQATHSAERNGDEHVFIKAERCSHGLFPSHVRESIRAIEALMEDQPAEPTESECLAAVNRARHRGCNDWRFLAFHYDGETFLEPDELMGLGKLLIERERAEAAKGGA